MEILIIFVVGCLVQLVKKKYGAQRMTIDYQKFNQVGIQYCNFVQDVDSSLKQINMALPKHSLI